MEANLHPNDGASWVSVPNPGVLSPCCLYPPSLYSFPPSQLRGFKNSPLFTQWSSISLTWHSISYNQAPSYLPRCISPSSLPRLLPCRQLGWSGAPRMSLLLPLLNSLLQATKTDVSYLGNKRMCCKVIGQFTRIWRARHRKCRNQSYSGERAAQ